jgi:DNA-binding transcriptional LysR family regulator
MAQEAFDCCVIGSNIFAMDKLHAIEAFIKIVDAGSITAAADALEVSQPSMVRTLAALERELGVRLLNRTTRRMSLTDEGRDYYERARHIVAAVEDAQQSLSARRATPRGRLRIASSVAFGRALVAPEVSAFLAAHPQINIELLLLDRVVDLVEEGIDVAVRIARLPDSSLVAQPLGEAHRVVVASPALIRSHGAPRAPADLRGQRCVSFAGLTSATQWQFGEGRKATHVAVKSVLVTNQVDAAVEACVSGMGYGRFNDYMVLAQIKAGALARVLQDFEGAPIPVNMVYPSARHQSPNVRSFVAFAQPCIRERLRQLQSLVVPTAKRRGGLV